MDTPKQNISNKDIAKIFWQHLRPYRGWAFLMISSLILGEATYVLVPVLYKRLFDTLANAAAESRDNLLSILVGILISILAIYIVNWLFVRLGRFINNYVQPSVMADLERTSFAYLLDHSHRFFANNFTGSLVRKIRRLSKAFEDITDNIEFNLLPLAVNTVGALIVISFRSLTLSLITLAWLAFFIIANYLVARWKLKYDEQRAAKDSEVTGVLADAITNHTSVQLFVNAEHERKIFYRISLEWRKLLTFAWRLAEINDGLQWALMVLIEFVVMYLAVKLWAQGVLTIGDFALLQGYLVSLFASIHHLGRIIRRTYESLADAKEMVAILKLPHEVADRKEAKNLHVTDGALAFNDVTFSYRGRRAVLKNFNLIIKPKEKVALVGPSGAGKSTIVQLLFRMHDIQKGEIVIDGQDISRLTLSSLRRAIALVPQDTVLFHRPLMENIRYGRLNATDEEVIAAAQKARCHQFITALPEGYNTYVGERGIKLSGGERQRIAIARAILKDAPILVLDEATSSLDSESEKLIQEALEVLMRDKTTIVIAHRLSTILKMDRIIVIEDGKIAAAGAHQELMRQGGLYKKLWEIQSSGFIA